MKDGRCGQVRQGQKLPEEKDQYQWEGMPAAMSTSMTAILYELCHLQASSINFDVP